MKRAILYPVVTIVAAYLLCLARAANAAEPMQFEIGVSNVVNISPKVKFSLWSVENGSVKSQLTPWQTNAIFIVTETVAAKQFAIGRTNEDRIELGFTEPRAADLSPMDPLPPLFIRKLKL